MTEESQGKQRQEETPSQCNKRRDTMSHGTTSHGTMSHGKLSQDKMPPPCGQVRESMSSWTIAQGPMSHGKLSKDNMPPPCGQVPELMSSWTIAQGTESYGKLSQDKMPPPCGQVRDSMRSSTTQTPGATRQIQSEARMATRVHFASPVVVARSHDGNDTDVRPTALAGSPLKSILKWPGLQPPRLRGGERVTGATKETHRLENKRRRVAAQEGAAPTSYWTRHDGQFRVPTTRAAPQTYVGQMRPSNLALEHPAANILLEYSMRGCPVRAGRNWTLEEMEAAIQRGPHVSALEPAAMEQLQAEVAIKVQKNQVRVVRWDELKEDPPPELKISPIAMIPHKSRQFRAILDLSFACRLENNGVVESVNASTTKTAPKGAIDQMGHSLM